MLDVYKLNQIIDLVLDHRKATSNFNFIEHVERVHVFETIT